MRMARVNVYLPDDLAAEAKSADLNVSALTQDAIRRALEAAAIDGWLAKVRSRRQPRVDPDLVAGALADAKSDLWGDD